MPRHAAARVERRWEKNDQPEFSINCAQNQVLEIPAALFEDGVSFFLATLHESPRMI